MTYFWCRPALWSGLLAAVLVAIAWVLPGLLDGAAFEGMLQSNYRLPELVSAYVPELLHGVRLSLLAGIGAAVCGFLAWLASMLVARPTGPGQVARSRRCWVWFALGAATAVTAYITTAVGVFGALDTIDGATATRAAASVALGSLLVFWVFCLLGTERMIRPAVPCGARFPVSPA